MNMSEAIGRMLPGDEDDKAHATRPHRFFANLDHQDLFAKHYATLYQTVRSLERSGVGKTQKNLIKNTLLGGNPAYDDMSQMEKDYFNRFCAKRGIDLGR